MRIFYWMCGFLDLGSGSIDESEDWMESTPQASGSGFHFDEYVHGETITNPMDVWGSSMCAPEHDSFNPASGLPVLDENGGFEIGGDLYGTDHIEICSASFEDDSWTSSTSDLFDTTSNDACGFSDW